MRVNITDLLDFRRDDGSPVARCAVCSHRLHGTTYEVELTGDGLEVLVDGTEEDRAEKGYRGTYRVGSTCWRKIQRLIRAAST